jgi:hypothetical protein
MKRLRYAAVLATLAGVLVVVGGAQAGAGVKTAKGPYLVPAAPGVKVDAILSTGDVVGDYQMSGIPDGLGAYANGQRKHDDDDDDDDSDRWSKGRTITIVMNHELGKTFPGQPPGVDARISRLEVDRKTHGVVDAEYLFTGLEGFERFCSATLRIFDGRPIYFTGEEAVNAGHDGSSIALDPETGMWRETPQFGRIEHENVVPTRLSKWVFLTSEDDFRAGEPSFLYAYIASDFNRALRGRDGDVYVWKADNPAKTGNATVAKGEPVPGHFVLVPKPATASSASFKAAAASVNPFKFDRLEDIAIRPDIRGRGYFDDTGKLPTTERGRIYQIDINPKDPTEATITMILNGDPPNNDDLINPDNLDASRRVLVIQEDREAAFRGDPNRVLVYDFSSKTLKTVAYVRSPDLLVGPFNQESSGVIDASRLLGRNWWLLDVQAHTRRELQPGPTLTPNSAIGEDGQLDAIYIPHSTGGDGEDDD